MQNSHPVLPHLRIFCSIVFVPVSGHAHREEAQTAFSSLFCAVQTGQVNRRRCYIPEGACPEIFL